MPLEQPAQSVTGKVAENLSGEHAGTKSKRQLPLLRQPLSVKRFLKALGPGVVTGASDDDPSGIGTYAFAGAAFGYALLWTALVTFPMMACVQFICAKIGLVSGCGIAGVMRRHYARPLLHAVVLGLVVANTINVAADIAAVAAGSRWPG